MLDLGSWMERGMEEVGSSLELNMNRYTTTRRAKRRASPGSSGGLGPFHGPCGPSGPRQVGSLISIFALCHKRLVAVHDALGGCKHVAWAR